MLLWMVNVKYPAQIKDDVMSSKYQTRPFDNARAKILSIHDATSRQEADHLSGATQNYVETLEEYELISKAQRMVLDEELVNARCNWEIQNVPLMKRIKSCLKRKLATCKAWLAAKEQKWKTYWLKWVAVMTILALIFTFCMVPFFGTAISLSYLVTAAGLLLVAFSLLVRFKFLQDLATLLGIVLAGYWYIHSVGGAFNPVDEVFLITEQKGGYVALVKVVKDKDSRKQACSFDPTKAQLTCEVRIGKSNTDLQPQP